MTRQYNNYGDDQLNIESIQYINIIEDLPKVQLLRSGRFIQYFLVVFYLLATLVIWFFLGFFAVYEFPINYVFRLSIACLQGSESTAEVLKSDLKSDFSQVQEADLRAKGVRRTEYERLSREKSRLEVNEKLLRGLYGSYSGRDESASTILDEIEKREQIVDADLEVLKRKYDPNLHKLEELVKSLLGEKDSANNDIERIKRKLDDLAKRYRVETEEASNDEVVSLISELENFVKTNPDRISDSRLKIVSKTLDILRWISSSRREYLHPKSTRKPNSGLLEILSGLVIVSFCVLSLPLLNSGLENLPFLQNFLTPRPTPPEVNPFDEQSYWEQMHQAIAVWDLQTARKSLGMLKQSQNPCISEFALGLDAALESRGANGFKEVTLIESRLNERYNCSFKIPISGEW